MNRYEKELLQNCRQLDAITVNDGSITSCAEAIIESNQEGSIQLCSYIVKASELKNPKIIRVAIAVKDSLIKFHGHRTLANICKTKTSEDTPYTLEELMGQLNQLVGLNNVKSKINDLIAFQKIQFLRKQHGLHTPKNTMHLAFTGNPGTGKTTVARIVGRIYHKIGLLSTGHFIEVSRTDLIAGYQGQTAHKVKGVIERARGGVLFIDEAYSITENDHSDSYGRECLTELTKALEDYREDLVVIVAGYTKPMKQFFSSNPGLESRFNTFIEFDDYNEEELFDILQSMCSQNDYVLSEETKTLLRTEIKKEVKSRSDKFSNGRYIRNLFENMAINHARRVSTLQNPTISDLKTLYNADYQQTTEVH